MDVCCIKGCDDPVLALGLCNKHWRRNKLYGSPIAVKGHGGLMRGLSAPERFARQMKSGSGCWIWIGSKDKDGYGMFRGEVGGVKFDRAHRYSYAYHKGKISNGLHVLHSCDNPSCVNPEHLSLGSNAENMADKIMKGRQRVPQGELSPHAILSEEDARKILNDPRPYTLIAADFGVAASTIGSIKNGESWGHLEIVPVKGRNRGRRGEQAAHAKLNEDIVRAIRASDEPSFILAKRYDITQATICDIRKGRSWKHVK